MGVQSSSNRDNLNIGEEVNFDHFQILRAIGKGSFGKVCIVQKKDTKQMYAMKYMSKSQCIERDAMKNVLKEMEILTTLEHPFLVNLWFCFQDEEDLFMVSDLLLGGDLRYHITQDVKFTEETIHLYAFELGLALDYLKTKHIIHRDIKPDNILLDEEGHAHITDFNIATVLEENQLATSMSGTKPYIAPEIFLVALDECIGYSYPADWWSLGVTLFEILARGRPFDIHSHTSVKDMKSLINSPVHYPSTWSDSTKHLLAQLLITDPKKRLSNAVDLTRHSCLQKFNMETIMEKQIKPGFTPPRDHLNCDPTFELEEMIVEARPLHKKKKRLAKQRSLKQSSSFDIQESDLEEQLAEFRVYNRERELIRRALEKKENDWEAELIQAMNESTITSCEVKPKLSQEETPGQDSSNASSTLLNLPPSILLDQRRRSSCKLSVSPLSVQTRLAASPQRNKEVKQTSETATNSNKPKKKVLNRQQTLQRLPYINVNEIITVDSQQLVETCENGGRKNTGNTRTGNSDKLGHDTIDEESKESGPCDNEQTENESEMSLANVLIEIENLNRKDSVDGNSIRKSEDCVTTKENQEIEENENRIDVKAVEDTNRTESVTENQALDDSTKTAENNNYNYELTRFKVTKSEHEKTNLGRQEECDSASKTTETQLEKYLNIEETSKQIDSKGNNKIDPEKSKDIPGSNDTSNESNACTKTGIGEQTLESEETTNNTGVGTKPNKKDNKSDGQISTAINNNETDNKENETTKTRNSNNTKSATSETLSTKNTSPLNPLNLPDISVSYEQSESQSKDTISEAPKSPLRSDRSPNRSPMRSPKLGDIPTRSVLKNSLYRTDSTDSTKSLEKSPKRSYKVSFSCDVEDNSEQPKSPATKLMHGNSKSLDTESGEQQNTTKKEKKKK